jgi:hypothetical protein
VADFLVDHSVIEVPVDYVRLEIWTMYFDGSRHKSGTGIGILVISPDRILMDYFSQVHELSSYSIKKGYRTTRIVVINYTRQLMLNSIFVTYIGGSFGY